MIPINGIAEALYSPQVKERGTDYSSGSKDLERQLDFKMIRKREEVIHAKQNLALEITEVKKAIFCIIEEKLSDKT